MPSGVDIRVVSSGGFKAALLALVPAFERATGHKVTTEWGSSIGDAPTSIPSRLRRGEPIDLVILAGDPLDRLMREGRIVAGSRVDLARSGIGIAVRAGAPKPDIGSADSLKRALLQAKSIAYSSSASGVYLESLLQRLGIAASTRAQDQAGRGRARRQGHCARRCRDRLPAGERASPRCRHRLCRAAAGGDPGDHGVRRRHPRGRPASGCCPSAGRLPDIASRRPHHQHVRDGASAPVGRNSR